MSKYDPVEFAEKGVLTYVTDKQGHVKKMLTMLIDGRSVDVWQSDMRDENGVFPIMGRFLHNFGKIKDVDGYVEVLDFMVTKPQAKYLCKKLGRLWLDSGIVALQGLIAKQLDNIKEKIDGKVRDQLIKAVLVAAVGKIDSELIDQDVVSGLIDGMITF